MPNDSTESLEALCDFVGGSSISDIARRYKTTIHGAERRIRNGFARYGIASGRPSWTRVLAVRRSRPRTLRERSDS